MKYFMFAPGGGGWKGESFTKYDDSSLFKKLDSLYYLIVIIFFSRLYSDVFAF